MNRFLRGFFLFLAAVFLISAGLVALDLHGLRLPIFRAKTFWVMIFAATFFAAAAWRFPSTARIKVFLVIFALLVVELVLQISCWLGLMPAVNTKEYLPWGRVYWTGEGLGNSIRNRYSWHFPEFRLERTNRIALIGDSFVEAVEVHRTRNMGVLLRERVEAAQANTTAMALGLHGMGPAQYLEILKYAQRQFAIRDAIMVIYLGSDITDCSPRMQFYDPSQFLYYSVMTNGSVGLDATGERTRATLERSLDLRHRPVYVFLPRLAVSHCMLVQVPLSVWRTRQLRKRIAQNVTHRPATEALLAQLGLKGEPFALQSSPEALEGTKILLALMDRASEFARLHNIQMQIVTVPFFPPDFYAQSGTNWSAALGDYDFFLPDRKIEQWAVGRGIPFLSLGSAMRASGLTPAEIRKLYLSNGCGHFSEAGHRFAADGMNRAFFSGQK